MQSAACVILIFTLTGVGKPPGDLPEGGTVMDKVHDPAGRRRATSSCNT